MKKIIFLVAIFLLLTAKSSLYAQQVKNDSLTFSGIVKSPKGKPLGVTISFNYTLDDFSGKTGIRLSTQTNSEGQFETKLPDLKKPYYFAFTIKDEKTNKAYFRTQSYYAESGDNIHMNITMDTVERNDEKITNILVPYLAKFTGKGAGKYQVAWELQNSLVYNGLLAEDNKLHFETRVAKNPETGKGKIRQWKDADDVVRYLEGEAKIISRYKSKKDSVIAASKVSTQMRKLLQFTYGGFEQSLSSHWLMRCKNEFDSYPAYREQIASIYLKYDTEFSEQPDDNAVYSRPYLSELTNRLIFVMLIRNKANRVDIDSFYNTIKAKYVGGTRDYLWRIALAPNTSINKYYLPFAPKIKDSILVDALTLVKMPHAKSFLEDALVTLRKNNLQAYDGEFNTLTGEKLNLSSLRGKIVLLDVWFNGCVGCAKFHEAFETIYPKFKNNKNFVVLSVNVDKSQEKWVSGIDSKHYTSRDSSYINVTTGNWFDHPFMKYYNITGASYVMLIDNEGKILPTPSLMSDLSNTITLALNKI